MHQLKDRDCQNGSKNTIQLSVVYKKPILLITTYRLKVIGEKYTMLMLVKNKQEQLYSFQSKQASKQGKLSLIGKALHNDKGFSSPRRYQNS